MLQTFTTNGRSCPSVREVKDVNQSPIHHHCLRKQEPLQKQEQLCLKRIYQSENVTVFEFRPKQLENIRLRVDR